jgi:hypothetical protein
MQQTLMELTISALNEWSRLKDLQELLELAIEQLEGNNKATLRLELLITCYLSTAELRLDELRTSLENLRSQLRIDSDSEQITPPL